MKILFNLLCIIALTVAPGVDAFVVMVGRENKKLPSSSSLKDVGMQWGFDSQGCRQEYLLEHWSERNNDHPSDYWPYQPWSGVSQTVFVPRNPELVNGFQQEFASAAVATTSSSVPAQEVAQLPPAQSVQPMPQPMPDPAVAAYEASLRQASGSS